MVPFYAIFPKWGQAVFLQPAIGFVRNRVFNHPGGQKLLYRPVQCPSDGIQTEPARYFRFRQRLVLQKQKNLIRP
jgi:hypothetical protein